MEMKEAVSNILQPLSFLYTKLNYCIAPSLAVNGQYGF